MRAEEGELTESQLRRLVPIADAARLMKGLRGSPPHEETVRRWANPRAGCRLPGGGVAVLRVVKMSGCLLTLPEWVEAFERRRAEAGRRGPQPDPEPPERSRRAGRRAAHRWLESHGYAAGAAAG